MPIIINQISSSLNAGEEEITEKALNYAHIDKRRTLKCKIHKTSLDARKQNDIHFVHSVYAELDNPELEKRLCEKNKNLTYVSNSEFKPVISNKKQEGRIVITGFGPAGMFCGLVLAEYGYKPLILERGENVDKRTETVNKFWYSGDLNENSNVQFGEGGAGPFSDGKLTTRIKDPLCRYVLERFAEFGAPEEIITKSKPHVGTDNLRKIVKGIRERILSLGGEIRFEDRLTNFTQKDNKIDKIYFESGEQKTSALVLAIGHSARDTFELLERKGIFLEPKPFSVGARIEHKQYAVEESLYGKQAGNPLLPKGEYQLSYRDKSGRGVYTFCMCPGGTVVPSASESGGVVTNGMSEFARDGENANAALVVGVTPDDFGKKPLDGVNFARTIERNAFNATGSYKACGTTVKGFLDGKPTLKGGINPTYSLGLEAVDFRKIFPEFVTDMMETGLRKFTAKMKCFGDGSAMLTAPETRTSSPVRITRNPDTMTSLSCDNLYPCGEGAGYAGGIMSAAVDGIRTALKIMENIAP